MKTRGKTKVQNPDYSKDGSEARETMDDGNETNGYSEDKSNEVSLSWYSLNNHHYVIACTSKRR